MTLLAAERVMEAAAIMRDEQRMKDKSYRRFPVGRDGARWLRALRWEGKSQNTIDSYESVLRELALRHADFDGLVDFCTPVGTEYLREFLDVKWGDSTANTKAQRTAVIRSLFKWAAGERIIPWNPASTLKGPKAHHRVRNAYSAALLARLFRAQDSLRDTCALELMGIHGLRKNDVRMLQIVDIDLARDVIALRHRKANEDHLIPIEVSFVRDDLELHLRERDRLDEYLIYPKRRRHEPMDPASVHRWFKRCLERAALPATIQMHELRHTAGNAAWQESGDMVKAQGLLGHASVETTRMYLHPDLRHVRTALRAVEDVWTQEGLR